jgi:hypothetical protein
MYQQQNFVDAIWYLNTYVKKQIQSVIPTSTENYVPTYTDGYLFRLCRDLICYSLHKIRIVVFH